MVALIKKYWASWTQVKLNLKAKSLKLFKFVQFTESMIGALIIALILRQFIVQSSLVFSGSMIPTLNINDRLIVNKLVYKFNPPDRGDIVLFYPPINDNRHYVKRLVGLPGDTIEIRRGIVYINQEPLVFPGVTILRDYSFRQPEVVPDGHYFMMGDNRSNSQDSRFWGYVPKENLIGEALFTYWPINRIRWVR